MNMPNDINVISQILKNILSTKEPWYTWKGFCVHSIQMLVETWVVLHFFNPFDIVFPWYFLIVVIPWLIYVIIFLIKRSWLDVETSRRMNVVFAYNLQNIEDDRFQIRYDRFIESLRNKINFYELGHLLKIISKPIDIKFPDNTTAEVKTRLGLLAGSTLLVHGYAVRKRGKIEFLTKFSYEFFRPKSIVEENAKEIFSGMINHGLRGRFFGLGNLDKFSIDIDQDIIGENSLAAVIFILGLTAASCNNIDKTIQLFEAFRDIYANADLLTKKAMGPARSIIDPILVKAYAISSLELIRKGDYKNAHQCCMKAIPMATDVSVYDLCIKMAYCCEKINDRPGAKKNNDIARKSANKNQYAHIINDAYFLLDEGRYTDAINAYDSIPDYVDVSVNDVQMFLYNKYNETREPAFLFAEGYVVFRWKDRDNGRIILKEFLGKAEECGSKYSDLLIKSTKLI